MSAKKRNYQLDCYAFNLRRAARLVTKRYEDCLRPLDMSAFQFTALMALSQAEYLPQRQLADFFGMDPSTLNRNIKAIVRRDWVELTPDPDDSRKRHVRITREGKRTLQRAIPLWESAQKETESLAEDFDWDRERAWLHAVSGVV